jgi:beta-glucosidase
MLGEKSEPALNEGAEMGRLALPGRPGTSYPLAVKAPPNPVRLVRTHARTVLAGLIAVACVASPGARAAEPAPGAIAERAQALLGRMSLAEKIGQLDLSSNNPDFRYDAVERGAVGGVIAFTSASTIAAVDAAARRSRLGIPLLVGLDIVHGLRTMYPVPLGEAASFDPGLAREIAEASGREASAIGINWTFGPVADLSRDPRWGRIVEGFGEDPLMGRLFTAARVAGFHAGGIATTLKHFAGYGASVGGRDYDSVDLSTSALFDDYLPPFKAGIDAGSESVMGAFIALNGVPTTMNAPLMTGILRDRLGFGGFVVSDWYAIQELVKHGVAFDDADASRKAILAGTDMDMASGLYSRHLAGEVEAGRVPMAVLDNAVRRVLGAKIRMGLMDRPAADPPAGLSAGPPPPPSAEARALSRRAAQDSIVLLRNGGVLPLRAGRRIAVIGAMAASGAALAGPHAALVHNEDGVTLVDGLRRRAGAAGMEVVQAHGCDAFCHDEAGFADALAVAQGADVIVAALGEPIEMTGEAASRAHLTLTGRQGALLDRLVETGKPVVLVLMASRPVELGPAVNRLAGLLMAWYPGTEGGTALADLLFGDVSPSAKLPVTWPRTIGQVPLPYDALPTGRPPDPSNRFALRFADEALTPLYPFGFGMTYTRFALADIVVAEPSLTQADTLAVSVRLSNTGERAGREVVQLYVRQRVASRSRPLRRLAAFEKVALAPGESRVLTLRVPVAALGYHDDTGRYLVEPGPFTAFVGTASDTTAGAPFAVVAR